MMSHSDTIKEQPMVNAFASTADVENAACH